MQRFKENNRKYANAQYPIKGAHPEHGKFVYGADGTQTRAACWRAVAFVEMPRYPGETLDRYKAHLKHVRQIMDSSRRDGCRLP